MAFQYDYSRDNKLRQSEEDLLLAIDEFPYSLNGYNNLGDLHHRLSGGLFVSNEEEKRTKKYIITKQEHDTKIKEWNNRITVINNQLLQPIINRRKQLTSIIVSLLHATDAQSMDKSREAEEESRALEIRMVPFIKERNTLENLRDAYKAAQNLNNGMYEVRVETFKEGKYDNSKRQVVLYFNTKHRFPNPFLLAVVYVHEMMHAYLDCGGITLPELEEPIVEYGMLSFFKAFGDAKLLEYAQKEVKNKQDTIGVAHYGFGHCIFKNPYGVDWLNDYLSAKPRLFSTSPEVKRYLDFWRTGLYPIEQEQDCLQALYDALHPGATKNLRVKKGSASRGGASANKKGTRRSTFNGNGSGRKGSRRYTINSKGRYSMYEVVEEFVKFLIGRGRTIISINQEIQGYLNSGWIFVSSNPGQVAWSNEKGEYSSSSGFYITKQWKGNANGNFTKLKDSINSNYKNFQIIEI